MKTETSAIPRASRPHLKFYGGLLVLYVVLLTGWWTGNHLMIGQSGGTLIAFARLFGLMAGFSVLTQVFLMSRAPLVDKHFNLHEIVRLHRWNGYCIVSFISLHVVCMTLGYAGLSDMGWWAQFLQLVTTYRDVFKALLGAILIFTAFSLSIGAARRRVPYEFWYFVHLTIYVAILLVFFHQVNTGGDLIKDDWFRYYWLGLYVLAFSMLMYFRVFRIGLWYVKYGFSVDKITQEAEGIYSVYITGRGIEKFQFEPGQYAGWRLLNRRWWWQSHPYSFSGKPGDSSLRFTINTADGNFTRTLPSLAPGTKLLMDGPRGSFTTKRVGSSHRVVLIAGGVGITPFIPLIPKLQESKLDVCLLYAARTPAHVAFRKHIAGFQAQGLKFQEYISAPQAGSPGQVDRKVLKPYCDGDTTFYICGPPPMVATLRKTLRELGVANVHVVTERFNV